MFWHCCEIDSFWKYVITTTSRIIGHKILQDPELWMMGDMRSINARQEKKYLILLAGTAAKKCILTNWKSEDSPSTKQWINELTSYCTPEKILYNIRGKPKTFEKIWGPFLNFLSSVDQGCDIRASAPRPNHS